jgi:hypothetical protein
MIIICMDGAKEGELNLIPFLRRLDANIIVNMHTPQDHGEWAINASVKYNIA